MVEEFILFYFKNIHAMQPRLAFNYVAQTDFEFTIPCHSFQSPGIPSENRFPLHSQGFLFVWGVVSCCAGWPKTYNAELRMALNWFSSSL